MWFSHVGFWVRWAPRPTTHSPETPPNHDLLLICVLSGLISRRFLVHIFKKIVTILLIGVRSGMHFCTKKLELGNDTNEWVGARPTILARWRGCRRQLDIPSELMLTIWDENENTKPPKLNTFSIFGISMY